MTRAELIRRTRQLVAEGERLLANPSFNALQVWLQRSDDLLAAAWGSMDRYHLAWLLVGKPKGIVRGRPMTPDEEAAYVVEVARQKTAALRMSLDAVERQGLPFVGETGSRPGDDAGASSGSAAAEPQDPAAAEPPTPAAPEPPNPPAPEPESGADAGASSGEQPRATAQDAGRLPRGAGLAERVAEARRRAAEHAEHDEDDAARAPRPPRMLR